jgi:protein involved in sex pheromone biosynthesis
MKRLIVISLTLVLILSACNNSPSDTAAPTISSISVSVINETSAKVTWIQVEYGETTIYGSSTSLNLTTDKIAHAVNLTNLVAGTKYYYRVRSIDAYGNERISSGSTFYMTP